jgi:hypothetical protein
MSKRPLKEVISVSREVTEGALLEKIGKRKRVKAKDSYPYMLAFESTPVPGLMHVNITKYPLTAFYPERLIIHPDVCVDFSIVDIKIGENSQLSMPVEVPAVVFAPTAFGIRLKMDVCEVSMGVTITARNTNTALRNFSAVVMGDTAVEP